MIYLLAKTYNIKRFIKLLLYPYWNRIKFRIKGIQYGYNMNISTGMYLSNSATSKIKIGNNFIFTSGDCINPLCRNIKGCIIANRKAIISIGNNVGMSSPCIWSHTSITIGNNVNIGGDCIIMDSDAHSLNYLDRRDKTIDQMKKRNTPIVIEDDVLIGARCIILKGVRIGARSIIGAGSVVTKSIPSDEIWGGNPATYIKSLNK